MIPGDKLSPKETSGLRIGFAAVTSRGCSKVDAKEVARIIYEYLSNKIDANAAKDRVNKLVKNWKQIENI